VVVKNIVALGALAETTRLFPAETYLTALRQALRDKGELLALDERAFAAGMKAAGEAARTETGTAVQEEVPCQP